MLTGNKAACLRTSCPDGLLLDQHGCLQMISNMMILTTAFYLLMTLPMMKDEHGEDDGDGR